jgi:hypothetical protein
MQPQGGLIGLVLSIIPVVGVYVWPCCCSG